MNNELVTSKLFILMLLGLNFLVYSQNEFLLNPFAISVNIKNKAVDEIVSDSRSINEHLKYAASPTAAAEFKNISIYNDTLSYRRSLGGNWDTDFGLYGHDYIVQWYQAPTDLTIKAIGATFSENANNTECFFYIYKVGNGITINDLVNVGSTEVKQGRFKSADPIYGLGYVGFEDESDGSGYENVGNLSAFPFAELIWSPGFQGYFIPIASPSSAPVYQFFETKDSGIEPIVSRGEIFAIVLQNSSTNFGVDRIGVWTKRTSFNPDYYGWKFYAHGKIDGDTTTAFWYSEDYTFDFAVIVDLGDDCFPRFRHTSINTNMSTEPRKINVAVICCDTISSVNLHYSTDNGFTWQIIPMLSVENYNYECMIPGFTPGTTINYFFAIADTLNSSCSGHSTTYTYTIFQKQNDVLFIYNSTNFTANTARRIYIGGTTNTPYIVDPVENDVWLASYGTSEAAQVMSLYNWIIQVDGSFPQKDYSAAAKAYLDGATETNKRAYFLSSQDYGCLLNGTCADTDFVAGDFQYDYLGLEKLGPQDLISTAGVKVQLAPVAGDPLSGWVNSYSTANGVTYFYDPTYELGFTGYIDAMTPNSNATPIFTKTNSSEVVAIRNEDANWKTAFLAFDYAASNFRSDTSLTPVEDLKYKWSVEVGNQALAFLEWAGYIPSNIQNISEYISNEFKLFQNYPNPFNPNTKISWQSPVGSWQTLKVYDVLGNEVATLVDEYKSGGSYEVEFQSSVGSLQLASGVYYYQLIVGNFIQTKKMILIR